MYKWYTIEVNCLLLSLSSIESVFYINSVMMAKINYLYRCQYVNGDRKSCTEEHRQGRCVDRVGASTAVVKESSLMCILYNALLMGGEWIKTVKNMQHCQCCRWGGKRATLIASSVTMCVDGARGDDAVRFEEHRAYAALHEQTVYPMMKWQGDEVDWNVNW